MFHYLYLCISVVKYSSLSRNKGVDAVRFISNRQDGRLSSVCLPVTVSLRLSAQIIESDHRSVRPQLTDHRCARPQLTDHRCVVSAQIIESDHRSVRPQWTDHGCVVSAQIIESDHRSVRPQLTDHRCVVSAQIIESDHRRDYS